MPAKSTLQASSPDFQTLKQALRDATLIKSSAQFASLAPLGPEITELLKRGYRQKEIMAILASHQFIISKSTFSRFVKTLGNTRKNNDVPNQLKASDNQTSIPNELRPDKKLTPEELTAVMRQQPDLKQLEEDARELLRNR